jgi:hypothetical protein
MVGSKTFHHGRARLIEADHLNLGPVTPQFQHNVIKGTDSSDVPEMCLAYIDANALLHILIVEGINQTVGRSKEDLSGDEISNLSAVVRMLGDYSE